MKVYTAKKGYTFVDKNGVNYGSVVQSNNIDSLTQIPIETKKSVLEEIRELRKQPKDETKTENETKTE